MDRTFFIETWGCQMNDLDSQRLSGLLRLRGFRRVESEKEAGLVLLNTCSIREKSEQKVFSRLGRLRELKARGTTIAVAGCVAQQEGEEILKRAPYVDFVLGPGSIGLLDDLLSGRRRVAVEFPEAREYDYLSVDRPSAVRAQVTIIEGCNKNCTFCIVPTTRGREVSRPMRQILDEVAFEVGKGRGEIELLGQTVNAYRCPATGSDFAGLLRSVASIPGVRRLRFVTSHPAEVRPEMIDVIRDFPNISRYLHLPVQSGSSSVLRRMKRLYTRERYLELVREIRKEVPDIMFSTDVIVGFPGETEADFQQTLSLMEEVRFGSVFAFKYSKRPGTPALRLKDPVDDSVAGERLSRLFALQERIETETLQTYIGREVLVLYEGFSKHEDGRLCGRTDSNLTVNFHGRGEVAPGSLIAVRIIGAQHHTLRGEAVA